MICTIDWNECREVLAKHIASKLDVDEFDETCGFFEVTEFETNKDVDIENLTFSLDVDL